MSYHDVIFGLILLVISAFTSIVAVKAFVIGMIEIFLVFLFFTFILDFFGTLSIWNGVDKND